MRSLGDGEAFSKYGERGNASFSLTVLCVCVCGGGLEHFPMFLYFTLNSKVLVKSVISRIWVSKITLQCAEPFQKA